MAAVPTPPRTVVVSAVTTAMMSANGTVVTLGDVNLSSKTPLPTSATATTDLHRPVVTLNNGQLATPSNQTASSVTPSNNREAQFDFLQYYKQSGLEYVASEVGLISSDKVALKLEQPTPPPVAATGTGVSRPRLQQLNVTPSAAYQPHNPQLPRQLISQLPRQQNHNHQLKVTSAASIVTPAPGPSQGSKVITAPLPIQQLLKTISANIPVQFSRAVSTTTIPASLTTAGGQPVSVHLTVDGTMVTSQPSVIPATVPGTKKQITTIRTINQQQHFTTVKGVSAVSGNNIAVVAVPLQLQTVAINPGAKPQSHHHPPNPIASNNSVLNNTLTTMLPRTGSSASNSASILNSTTTNTPITPQQRNVATATQTNAHQGQPMTPSRPIISQPSPRPMTPALPVPIPMSGGGVCRPLIPQTPAMASMRKRLNEITVDDFIECKKPRKDPKSSGKGLRHFSMKVCEKVKSKGHTTYNEVADELVAEFSDPLKHFTPIEQAYDQKNIRRRVYDALNVLMAMNIIQKERKEIKWIGLPTNSAQECEALEAEKEKRIQRIKQKTQQLHELVLQQLSFKNLVERNRDKQRETGPPPPNSTIQLPFIVVNTSKQTVIDCSISNDKYEYLFNFDNTFEIHDDIEVLKRMRMAFGLERGNCTQRELTVAKTMLSKQLEPVIIAMARDKSTMSTSITAGPSGLLPGEGVNRAGFHVKPSSITNTPTTLHQPGPGSGVSGGASIVQSPTSTPTSLRSQGVNTPVCTGESRSDMTPSHSGTPSSPSSHSRSDFDDSDHDV